MATVNTPELIITLLTQQERVDLKSLIQKGKDAPNLTQSEMELADFLLPKLQNAPPDNN